MAQGRNTVALAVNLVQLAPAIVQLIKMFGGTHTGVEKKAAAVEAGKQILIGAGQAALANNPKFDNQYGAVIQAAYNMATVTGSLDDTPTPTIPAPTTSGASSPITTTTTP